MKSWMTLGLLFGGTLLLAAGCGQASRKPRPTPSVVSTPSSLFDAANDGTSFGAVCSGQASRPRCHHSRFVHSSLLPTHLCLESTATTQTRRH